VRRVPGGVAALRLRRQAAEAGRRRLRPPRPPLETPDRVARLSLMPTDETFITGNGFAGRCRYVLNYDVLTVNEHVQNDWWFCKADFLEYFFSGLMPDGEFVLFSHNSDRSIGKEFSRRLERASLVAWFAQNAAFPHPKLRAIPIGIANPRWSHGDQAALKQIQSSTPPKGRLFDASFSVATNPAEREYCLRETGLATDPPRPFAEYLEALASSYFCISPNGNGIDVHRTWEALYLRTVPVVTRSAMTDQHRDLPMIVLADWSEFRSIEFSPELYEQTMADWDPVALRLDRYLERITVAIDVLRRP